MILAGCLAAFVAISYGLKQALRATYRETTTRTTTPIHRENVRGDERPEVYIEMSCIKYYSHIDGRSIDDLVCK